MNDEHWRSRGAEHAYARLTALGLLAEIAVAALVALFAFAGDEPSDVEIVALVLACLLALLSGWVLLFAPRLMIGSRIGRIALACWTAGQLLLLVGIAGWIAHSADPELGLEVGTLRFGFASAAFVVLVLTGCVRGGLASRVDPRADQRRRLASRFGLILAATCVALGVVAATADQTGLRCAAFGFDADRWRETDGTDRYRIAGTLVDCDTLIGKTRAELKEMLGEGGGRGRSQHFAAGTINVSDSALLVVRYDASGRVRRATL